MASLMCLKYNFKCVTKKKKIENILSFGFAEVIHCVLIPANHMTERITDITGN